MLDAILNIDNRIRNLEKQAYEDWQEMEKIGTAKQKTIKLKLNGASRRQNLKQKQVKASTNITEV